MTVQVKLHSLLQHKFAAGQDTFDVAATSPLECLHEMESLFPAMRRNQFPPPTFPVCPVTDPGTVRRSIAGSKVPNKGPVP